MHGDAAALMDLAHRRTAVRVGSAECCGEELDLFAFEPGHVGAGEEAGEFGVDENPVVEVVDDDFQRLVSADLGEDG